MMNGMTQADKKEIVKKMGLGIVVFAAAITTIVLLLTPIEGHGESGNYVPGEPEGLIEEDGVRYVPKRNIEAYLFMGIDNPGKVEKVTEYTGQGRCDVILLLVRDLSTGTYKTLQLNRNLLMEQDSLEPDGTYIGTSTAILALAHENGDGMEISCENVVKAVSHFLGGCRIDGYAALNMGAIASINHLAGGVTVTIEDDFSQVDSSLVQGETITLSDEQAVNFVHSRWYVDDESNESRMRRQTVYMTDLKRRLRHKCAEDKEYPLTIYEGLEEYMVTDITAQKFSKIALLMLEDRDEGELVIEGTSIQNDLGYMEMTADRDSVKKACLELFYREYD
ncbi:MAG: LCP family protein [Roseburia sp.]|nr:LCP family protein [Roseburia sp.]